MTVCTRTADYELCVFLLIYMSIAVHAALVTQPENTAARMYSSVQLNCSTDGTTGDHEWRRLRGGVWKKLTNNRTVLETGYDVLGTGDDYNLVLTSASMDQAGEYQCVHDMNISKRAEIVLLDDSPQCSLNASVVYVGDPVTLLCSVSFATNDTFWAPSLEWRHPSLSVTNKNVTTPGYTQSWAQISATGDPYVDNNYSCHLSFDDRARDSEYAGNAPVFTDSSLEFTVLAQPTTLEGTTGSNQSSSYTDTSMPPAMSETSYFPDSATTITEEAVNPSSFPVTATTVTGEVVNPSSFPVAAVVVPILIVVIALVLLAGYCWFKRRNGGNEEPPPIQIEHVENGGRFENTENPATPGATLPISSKKEMQPELDSACPFPSLVDPATYRPKDKEEETAAGALESNLYDNSYLYKQSPPQSYKKPNWDRPFSTDSDIYTSMNPPDPTADNTDPQDWPQDPPPPPPHKCAKHAYVNAPNDNTPRSSNKSNLSVEVETLYDCPPPAIPHGAASRQPRQDWPQDPASTLPHKCAKPPYVNAPKNDTPRSSNKSNLQVEIETLYDCPPPAIPHGAASRQPRLVHGYVNMPGSSNPIPRSSMSPQDEIDYDIPPAHVMKNRPQMSHNVSPPPSKSEI